MYNLLTPVTIPASDPLTLDAYTDFVLIPYIAAWLIGEDKGTDIEEGWEIMQLEGDHGDNENKMVDDDPVLDAVYAANAKRRKVAAAGDAKIEKKPKGRRVAKANKENTKPAVRRFTSSSPSHALRSHKHTHNLGSSCNHQD
jgi:hypothetical protein